MDIMRDCGTMPNRCIIRANVYDNFIVGPRCSTIVFVHFIPPPPTPPWLSLDFRERVRILFFNYICLKDRRGRGTPSDRFIKVVWHIRSPRLLPRPRVDNARERETRDILFYLLFHFRTTSRPSSLLFAPKD